MLRALADAGHVVASARYAFIAIVFLRQAVHFMRSGIVCLFSLAFPVHGTVHVN